MRNPDCGAKYVKKHCEYFIAALLLATFSFNCSQPVDCVIKYLDWHAVEVTLFMPWEQLHNRFLFIFLPLKTRYSYGLPNTRAIRLREVFLVQ